MPLGNRIGFMAVLVSLAMSLPAGAVPAGSYQQSCKDIKLKDRDGDSARLQAKCVDNSGEWRKTSFELDRCWGDLANIDGELICVADRSHGGGPGFRDGPYPDQAPARPVDKAEAKDWATQVCIDHAIKAAYSEGAGFARFHKIEDVDRKDAGRIKVKGVVLSSRDRTEKRSKTLPFRCDARQGHVIDFKWR